MHWYKPESKGYIVGPLHLYRTFLAPSWHPKALYNCLSFTQTFKHRWGFCHARRYQPHWEQFSNKNPIRFFSGLTNKQPELSHVTYWESAIKLNRQYTWVTTTQDQTSVVSPLNSDCECMEMTAPQLGCMHMHTHKPISKGLSWGFA